MKIDYHQRPSLYFHYSVPYWVIIWTTLWSKRIFEYGAGEHVSKFVVLENTLTYNKCQNKRIQIGWDDLKTVIIILAFSGGLSPVLMTLTDTISTDTVYAMTAFMLLANILFHDYGANAAM